MDDKKKKYYLNRFCLNIGFLVIAAIIIYFATMTALDLFDTSESNKSQQGAQAIINEKVEQFQRSIKNGQYLKAYNILEEVTNTNTNGQFNRHITEMGQLIKDDYNLISQSLYGETINDSIKQRIEGILVFKSLFTDLLEEQINVHYNSYINLQSDYQQTINFLKNSMFFGMFEEKTNGFITIIEELNRTRADYQKGIGLMEKGDYADAISYLSNVPEKDIPFYTDAQKRILECHEAIRKDHLDKARPLIDSGKYLDALSILLRIQNLYPDDKELVDKINYCYDHLDAMDKYEGVIYHISFRNLIVQPNLAFGQNQKAQEYHQNMVTVDEFNKILMHLYQRGYVLVDIHGLYEALSEDDYTVIQKRPMYLPKGKKPLILSIDDLAYHSNAKGDGFAERLVIDANGKITSVVISPDGTEVFSYSGDLVPIIERFVEDHPDFSYLGAKGIIALTGYEGILGYRTNLIDAENYKTVWTEARRVCDMLKASGWVFANNSYSYNEVFAGRFDLAVLQYDVERWKREVEPITGETDIYITPYGYSTDSDSKVYDYLISQGYYAICSIGNVPNVRFTGKALLMDRLNIDGSRMMEAPETLSALFDIPKILDPLRPINKTSSDTEETKIESETETVDSTL